MRRYLPLLLIILFPSSADSRESYDLPRLVEMALESRPEMRISASNMSESENLLKEAKSYYYPELNLNFSYAHLNERPYVTVPRTTVNADIDLSGIKGDYPILAAIPDAINVPVTIPTTQADIAGQDIFRLEAELKQPLFTGGKIKERVRQATYLKEINSHGAVRSVEEIKFQVESLYFQFVFANRALETLGAIESRVGVVVKYLDNLYKNYVPREGEAGVDKADYLKSEYVLSKILGYKSEATKLRDEAKGSLAIACGLESEDFSVTDEAEEYVHKLPLEELAELKGRARGNRPEIRQLELSKDISSSEIKRARAGYLPDIGIFGKYHRLEDNYEGSQKTFAAVGVGASVPIFNGLRTRSEISRAKAAHERAKSQKELMELKVSLEVEVLHNRVIDYLRKIDIAKKALQQAKERRQLESERYLMDVTAYEDYLEALEDEAQSQLLLTKMMGEYYITLSELHLALGA